MQRFRTIGLCLVLIILIAKSVLDSSNAADPPGSLPTPSDGAMIDFTDHSLELVMQNDQLAFYINKTTTEFVVKHKTSGDVWYSNPPNREQDERAEPFVKGVLSSQLSISYYNQMGQPGKMYTWNDSVSKEQFEIEIINDAVKVSYVLGDLSEKLAAPQRFTKERFEEILSIITDEAKHTEFKGAYRLIEAEQVYEQWMNNTRNKKESLLATLLELGYTQEDFDRDSRDSGIEIKEKVNFNLAIEYRLDGDQLVVTVPISEINTSEEYPINKISVLENFGATDQNGGYTFVPDGSGALIYHNQLTAAAQPFQRSVYGNDETIIPKTRLLNSERIRMPVFGMKHHDQALFAIIEQGEAVAEIVADKSGRSHSFYNVYSVYTLASKDEVRLSGSYETRTVTLFQSEMYRDDIIIRYVFLPKEQASYVGMAHYYQDYLVQKHQLARLSDDKRPFILELSGAIPKKASMLGIPYEKTEPLTTFEQATEIVDQLHAAGIDHIKLRYSGWFNGGMQQTMATSISPVSQLGGKSGWEKFRSAMDERNVQLYPDIALIKVYRNGWFDFGMNSRTATMINRKRAVVYPYHLAADLLDEAAPQHIIKPASLPATVQKFTKSYEDYGLEGLSLADLADVIASDYKISAVVNRQEALAIYQEQAAKLSASFPDLMVKGGNIALLPYYQTVIYAPMDSSDYFITDQSVPFYQMVLHGYIDYAGMPVNAVVDGDWRYYLLKALETGANVYMHWMYAASDTTKETEYDHLNSHHYKDWLEEAMQFYQELSNVLGDTRSRLIANHEQLMEGVYRTTFEGGKTITVNYNQYPVDVQGMSITAQSYQVGGD